MACETLVLCKSDKLYDHYKARFESYGFKDVYITYVEWDALYMLIRKLKPRILLIGSSYFTICTP
jgi:hypothetical protein